jgi:hypothetical protein
MRDPGCDSRPKSGGVSRLVSELRPWVVIEQPSTCGHAKRLEANMNFST